MAARRLSIQGLLAAARERLRSVGIVNSREEAEWLLAEVTGLGRSALWQNSGKKLEAEVAVRFRGLVERRAGREPLQQIIGRWPFLEWEIKVDRRALVPRPETEDLAWAARRFWSSRPPGLVADVGTGGGCLALGLAAWNPAVRVFAVDRDPQALSLAAENCALVGCREQVGLVLGDLLNAVSCAPQFSLVLANLPYVAPEEFDELEPEVREFDPPAALVAEDRGLALIRRLVGQAQPRLEDGGGLLLEMSPWQTGIIAAELRSGWGAVDVLPDRFCRPRIVRALKTASDRTGQPS